MKLDELDDAQLSELLGRCCGARAWVDGMRARRPFGSEAALLQAAGEVWWALDSAAWLEAFTHHPRIGADLNALRHKFASTAAWAGGEQAGAADAGEEVLQALAAGNRDYEARFGWIFIVCATGKTAAEMLALLRTRLGNDPAAELRIAAAEQDKITRLRLSKAVAELD